MSRQDLMVFPGGEDFAAGLEGYMALGVRTPDGSPFGEPVEVRFRSGASELPAREAPWFPYTNPDAPPPAPQGVNAMTVRFPEPGIWDIEVRAASGETGTAVVLVKEDPSAVAPGARAPATRTPTLRDPRGIDPICTRAPRCPLHEVSVADALRARVPFALAVGTPKFCSSQSCGPNLEELLAVRDEVGSDMAFIHAEVYLDDDPETIRRQRFAPAFRQWGLPSEPWLFVVGRDGAVRRRFEGPLTATHIREAIEEVR